MHKTCHQGYSLCHLLEVVHYFLNKQQFWFFVILKNGHSYFTAVQKPKLSTLKISVTLMAWYFPVDPQVVTIYVYNPLQ